LRLLTAEQKINTGEQPDNKKSNPHPEQDEEQEEQEEEEEQDEGEEEQGEGGRGGEEEGGDGAKKRGKKKGKKAKKVKKVKKRRRGSFNLNGNHHLEIGDYEALKDDHLKGFFYSERIRKHLVKMHLVILSS